MIGFGSSYNPTSSLRSGGRTTGRIQGQYGASLAYPSPFFDVAHTYLPTTVKALFKWCRYYFMTNPLINATIFKLAEYPITDVIVDHEDPEIVRLWTEFLQDSLLIRNIQVETGLDYNCYGTSANSLSFPFRKRLTCQNCGLSDEADRLKAHWRFTSYEFRMTCPRCGHTGPTYVEDQYVKSASGIKVVRWNVEDIDIEYNDYTGDCTHYYTIPAHVRNDIVMGRKSIVATTPQIFITGLREKKAITLSKDNLFFMKRPGLATQDRGWGTPLLLPLLKDVFYLQIMKKAQEAILLEHIVPLRILFPQAGSGTSDPFTHMGLGEWKTHVMEEIARWRQDPNYIPVMPLPLGNQTIGGDGKALLLTQEIQTWSDQLVVGAGVPREFVFGGLSWSGTNVSMRMLENAFLGYIMRQKAFMRFIVDNVAAYMRWPKVKIRFKPFKMADDMQRKAYRFQLNQAGKVSDTTLLADDDLDQLEENGIILRESNARIEATKAQQLAMAEIQGESQMIMMKFQAKAQQAMQEAAMAPEAPGEAGGPDQLAGGAPGGQMAEQQPTGGHEQLPQAQQQPALPAAGQQQQEDQGQDVPMGSQSYLSSRAKMQLPDGRPSMNVDLPSMAAAQAQMISQLDPQTQQLAIQNLQMQSPELADLVLQILRSHGEAPPGGGGGETGVDMRPLPEQRAPRRETTLV